MRKIGDGLFSFAVAGGPKTEDQSCRWAESGRTSEAQLTSIHVVLLEWCELGLF